MSITTPTNGGFNLNEVATLVTTLSADKEEELRAKFADLADSTSDSSLDNSADVLALQQTMNEWSFAVGLSSSMVKSLADTYKSTVQKMP